MPMEPPRTATRKGMAIGLAIIIAWAIFVATSSQLRRSEGLVPPSLARPEVDRPADFRWNLLDLDGKPVDFAAFKGKPILLNLWATWCAPCLKEMPAIANLAANPRLKEKGVVFLCVSIDDSPETPRNFVKDQPWPMTFLRVASVNSIPPAFQAQGIPATFVISPEGQIVTDEVGDAQWDAPAVVDFLEKLARPAHGPDAGPASTRTPIDPPSGADQSATPADPSASKRGASDRS